MLVLVGFWIISAAPLDLFSHTHGDLTPIFLTAKNNGLTLEEKNPGAFVWYFGKNSSQFFRLEVLKDGSLNVKTSEPKTEAFKEFEKWLRTLRGFGDCR